MEEWVEHHKDEVAAAQAEIAELHRRIAAGEILTDEEDEDEDDEGDSGDESGWESMDDDDAQAVLARMETMAREGGEDDSDDESDSDDAENMELDLTNAPVQLADNGYELIVTRDDGTKKRIGPRELRRYYKQRPRPEDQRPMVLANKAENHERGLARIAENGGRGITKFDSHGRFNAPMQISILVRRAQKASRRYEGMNMIKSGSGNKKFDMNGQNAKTKLPKACPY
jgi:pre-60S factor REI1